MILPYDPAADPWRTAAAKGADRMTVEDYEAIAKDLANRYAGPTFPATDRAPVLVEWDDATQPTGWVDPITLDKTPALCKSVGWIVHQDERVLVLAATVCDDEVMGAIRIPAGVVRKITSLTP